MLRSHLNAAFAAGIGGGQPGADCRAQTLLLTALGSPQRPLGATGAGS